jgi:hypothetical protein
VIGVWGCGKDEPVQYPRLFLNTGAPADPLRMYRKTADGKFQQFPTDKKSQDDFTELYTEEILPILTAVRQVVLLSDTELEVLYKDPNEIDSKLETRKYKYSVKDGLILLENDTLEEAPFMQYDQQANTMTAITWVSIYNFYSTILKKRIQSPIDLHFRIPQTDDYNIRLAEIGAEPSGMKAGDTLSLSLARVKYK